jgi:hypothetical protein
LDRRRAPSIADTDVEVLGLAAHGVRVRVDGGLQARPGGRRQQVRLRDVPALGDLGQLDDVRRDVVELDHDGRRVVQPDVALQPLDAGVEPLHERAELADARVGVGRLRLELPDAAPHLLDVPVEGLEALGQELDGAGEVVDVVAQLVEHRAEVVGLAGVPRGHGGITRPVGGVGASGSERWS